MKQPIDNMRIHFYGVQGSTSTFLTKHEIRALQDYTDFHLLRQVFDDLENHIGSDNRLDRSLEELIGGPVSRATLLQYKKKFAVPQPRIYGGWTTCVRVETSDGYDIVFDCGSGFCNCARDIDLKWGDLKERHLYIFGTHSHFDHIAGFDQAVVCFDPRNTLHIYGNYQYLYALDSYLGIFSRYVRDEVQALYTPISYSIMPAKFEGIEIRGNNPSTAPTAARSKMPRAFHDIDRSIRIGSTEITAINVYHAGPSLAYKVEHGGKKFIFCTDHERRHGPDPDDPRQRESEDAERRIIEHALGADVVYRDGQYLRSEYDGLVGIGSTNPIPRIDWGHSCIEDVQAMARECGVKQTYIGHHDPNRDWSERNWIDEALLRDCGDQDEKVELARAGTIIDL